MARLPRLLLPGLPAHVYIRGNDGQGLVQSMGRRYVSYFNYLHKRTGTLWEGRFGSCMVESERYFLVCHRYVELNPVRAGLAGMPGDYGWSSFRCNALGTKDDLVTPHSLYMELGADEARRRASYRRLFAHDIEPRTLDAIRHSVRKGWALGGEKFRESLEGQSGQPAAPRPPGRPRKSGIARDSAVEILPINLIGV